MILKEVRESAGLTQRELARLACVSRAAVSHVETGRYPPSARFAGKVCRALSSALGCVIHTWQVFPEQFRVIRAAEAGAVGLCGAGRAAAGQAEERRGAACRQEASAPLGAKA